MKNLLTALLVCVATISLFAQDTTFVQTFTFDDITKRRDVYQFPEPGQEFRKVLMYKTLKCDQATTQDGFACGEWDYLTYTFVYDSTGVFDSNLVTHRKYLAGGNDFQTIQTHTTPMSDVYQYAGTMISNIGYSRRETYIAVIGRHLNPINYNTQCITFGKPVSAVSYKELSVKIRDLSYEVSSIVYSHRDWGVGKIRPFIAHGQSTHKAHECVFAVTPHVSQDVYELRCQDSSALRWACVQSLAESIKLNKSFRKIRENDDVDLGEISPDESEFEDIDPAKYIKRRTIRMTCRYDYKFRKWHILAPTKEQLSLETEVRTGESSRYSTR